MQSLPALFSFLLVLSSSSPTCNALEAPSGRKVLLISLDGFRWDYPVRHALPGLGKVAAEGVRASRGMTPAFVTLTVPNHVTLSTGLYEENHGVVSYLFFDKELGRKFGGRKDMSEPAFWGAGEPVWKTAERSGLKSAVHSWAGSDVEGRRPSILAPYNSSTTLPSRVSFVLDALERGGASFAAVYHPLPDKTEHQHSIYGPEATRAIKEVDKGILYAFEALEKRGLKNSVNLIVVSDHGFTDFTSDEEHVIFLDDYISRTTDYDMILQVGAAASVFPKPGMTDVVVNKLRAAKRPVSVFRKDDIPAEFHYRNNSRIPPVLVLAKEGYYVDKNRERFRESFKAGLDGRKSGDHGYSNALPSMRPIFYATGPAFKKGFESDKLFDNVNVYPLVCSILGVPPAPNDGHVSKVAHFLEGA